ncbi:MAG: hypothetical protein ACTSQS_13455 [Promethearchaeota archaeon]
MIPLILREREEDCLLPFPAHLIENLSQKYHNIGAQDNTEKTKE